jgi:hypothetical protein
MEALPCRYTPVFLHSALYSLRMFRSALGALQTFTTTILILLQSSVIKPPSDTDSQLFADDNTDHTFPPSLYKFLVAFTDKAMSARKEYAIDFGGT